MTGRRDPSPWLPGAILLAFVVLATWYSVTIPLGEAPDEVPHYTYVRYLAQHGRLPTTREEHEAFQPPLYYALGAALTFWIEDEPGAPFAVRANADYDPFDPRAPKNLLLHSGAESWPYRGWALAWHGVRLLSVAFGAVTVWAIYRLGRVLFARNSAIPLAMAALAAFTPQFLFLSGVVNNDNAAVAFSALVLWRVAALLHCGGGPGRLPNRLSWPSAVLGLLLGLGMLSKASLIALAPIVGLAIVVAAFRCRPPGAGAAHRRSALPLALRCLLLAAGVAALVAGWYFLRNWRLFGDPLGWSFLLEVNARREGPLTPEILLWLAEGVFRSFWLGWIGISLDEPIYWLIGGACLVGGLGCLAWLVRRWRKLGGAARWTLTLLGLHAGITLASLVQWTATVLGTDQGRLIFPVLPTVVLGLAAGWAWWARHVPQWRSRAGPRAQTWLLGGLCGGMLCLAILTPIRIIAPVHAPAPIASDAQLAAATPLNVDWIGPAQVRLLGYRLESRQVRPGDKLVLDLYWQAVQPGPAGCDLMALIQLVDGGGKFLMYTDGSPSAGRDTTDRWKPGIPLASRHLLPVPAYGAPGDYRLTISLYPFGRCAPTSPSGGPQWLPAVGPDGSLIGDQLVLPETVRLVTP